MNENKFLGKILINKNCLLTEIKGTLNSGNSCHHSVQNILSSVFVSKIIRIEIYKNLIFPVVYGIETSSVTLRENHMMRVSENRVAEEGIWA
jgi:hypothetical protein